MFNRKASIEKQRADNAERMLEMARAQLSQALEAAKAAQDNAKRDREFLLARLKEAEKAGPSPEELRRAHEEAATARERERSLLSALRDAEAKARQADAVPRLEAEARALEAQLGRAEEALGDAKRGVEEVRRALDALAERADALLRFGIRATLVPRASGAAAGPGAEAAQAAAALARAAEAYAALERSLAEEGLGGPVSVATDAEVLRARARHAGRNAGFEGSRAAILEQAKLWIEDPKLKTYHVELLQPYVQAAATLLDRVQNQAAVDAARLSVGIVRRAQRESAGYLLRRSSALDGVAVRVPLTLDRYGDDPANALDRMAALLSQRRGVGAVDFFHNVAQGAARAVRAGEPGAAYAAWLLSDATLAILGDKRVAAWMAEAAA